MLLTIKKYNKSQTQPKNHAGYINPITVGSAAATAGYLFGKRSKTELEKELNQNQTAYQNEQQNHQQTKTERDNYQTKYQQEKLRADNLQNWKDDHICLSGNYQDKEQQIIQELNSALQLGLETPTLSQVITKIQELINKDPLTITNSNLEDQLQQAKQKIINLEKELAEKATPFGENLEIIKQLDCQSLERLFPQQFNNYTKQQIQNATNYQQLVNIRQDFIHKQLRQNQDNSITNSQPQLIQPAKQERIIWI